MCVDMCLAFACLYALVCAGNPDGVPIRLERPGGKVVHIWPILAHCDGDLPIREKLTRTLAHGNKHSCFQCYLEGETVESAGTVRCVCRTVFQRHA